MGVKSGGIRVLTMVGAGAASVLMVGVIFWAAPDPHAGQLPDPVKRRELRERALGAVEREIAEAKAAGDAERVAELERVRRNFEQSGN
jgi:hypothetical protein